MRTLHERNRAQAGRRAASARPRGSRRYTIQKTGGVSGNYDAEAYTAASYASNVSVEFTVADINECGVGLSADNPDASYTGIDFLIVISGGTAYRSANGVLTSLGAIVLGDVFMVSRAIGTGVVSIFKNGAAASTPTFVATSVASLRVDSFFRHASDIVTGVIVQTSNGYEEVTWTTTNTTVTEA